MDKELEAREEYNIQSYLRSAKDKYTYFLLAASASAIAFSITQTKTAVLSWSQIPLAFAVICWALSFYFGCRCVLHYQALLKDGADLCGMHNSFDGMPDLKDQVTDHLGDSYYDNLKATDRTSNKQFYLLITGGVLFICWHVIEMALRTINVT